MKTVKIGIQVWSAENLNVDHYRNGDIIPEVQDADEWLKLTTGAWCYYNNSIENGKKYGKLYNWYAVNDPRGLAPEGWHIPTFEDFDALKFEVNDDGNSLKSLGQGSISENGVGTNTTGFSALLSGYCNDNGVFGNLGSYTNYWSSTEYNDTYAYGLCLYYLGSNACLRSNLKGHGCSVRLLGD